MPVRVDRRRFRRNEPMQLAESSSGCIRIGLINNMRETALHATERQFVSLLNAASAGIAVELSLFSLQGMNTARLDAGSVYSGVERLWESRLDGLIVTGREPMTPDLRNEAYWGSFTEVVDWARDNTESTIWSCLGAHAAILHLDGIERRSRDEKHFGVYECARVSSHGLTAGMGRRFKVPHSRWNRVAGEELEACRYQVLTRTASGEIDTFVKQDNSLFVFFQGHPEYEADTLLREYRRDVTRYVRRESAKYPSLPRGYFDPETEIALGELQKRAMAGEGREVLVGLTSALEETRIENTWRSAAVSMYRNWLEYLCERKSVGRHDAVGKEAFAVGL